MFLSLCFLIEVELVVKVVVDCMTKEILTPNCIFPAGWDVVYDRLGDGCHVEYPVTLRPVLQYGKKCFCINSDGRVSEKPRIFYETVNVVYI